MKAIILHIAVIVTWVPIVCSAQQVPIAQNNQDSIAYVNELLSLSNSYLNEKNYEECIKCGESIVDKSILTDAERYQVLFNLGCSYINLNKPDKALPYWERACAMPKYTKPYDSYFLSHCYSSVGRYEEAITVRSIFLDYAKSANNKVTQIDYAQALDINATDFVCLEDYKNAIDYKIQCYEVHVKYNEMDLANRDLYDIALYYSMSGDYNKAIEIREQCNELLKENQNRDSQVLYARSLTEMASDYEWLEQYDKALSYGLKAYEIFEATNHIGEFRLHLLDILAGIYTRLNSNRDALRYYTEAAELSRSLFGETSSKYVSSLASLALCYSANMNYQKADSLASMIVSLFNDIVNPVIDEQVSILSNLASINSNIKRHDVAIDYLNQALTLTKKSKGDNNIDYANLLCKIAYEYKQTYTYEKAIELYKKGLEIFQTNEREISFLHVHHVSMLATLYEELGDYKSSLNLLQKSLELCEACTYGKRSDDYAFILARISTHYSITADYDSSLFYGNESLTIYKNLYGEESRDYANVLSNIANIYAEIGDYKQAISLAEKALAIKKKISGEQSSDYAITLGNISNYYCRLGDVKYALNLDLKVTELKKSLYGEIDLNYALALNQLALDYYRLNDYGKAQIYFERSYEIRKQLLGDEHPDVAISLNNLALNQFFYKQEYNKAIFLTEQANTIYKRFYGENHPLYALGLCNLAVYYRAKNDYQTVLKLLMKSDSIRHQILGPDHIDNGWGYNEMAKCYFNLGDINNALAHEIKCSSIFKKYILNNLSLVSSTSRENFWNQFGSIFDTNLPSFIYYAKRPDLSCLLYNESALFSKGLLLNTERSLRDIILESNDSSIISKYSDLLLNQSLLTKQYELPISQRYINIDSIEVIIRHQEKELFELSEEYGNYTRNMNLTWEDVQKSLGNNDIAIEFLSFRARNDSVMYVALTVDRDDSIPKMTTLFEKKQMDSISANDYYTTYALYHLIWSPLEKELEGKENVYFSPAGALYNIGIEYLPFNDRENIADKYNLVRLSSTRELVISHNEEKPQKAALYGGLLYNIDPEIIHEDNLANGYKQTYSLMTRGLEDSLNTRSDFNALSSTLREVENIDNMLSQNDLSTKLYTRYNGTEESFKDLDGKGINILHLATHGAYIPDSIAAQKKEEKNYRFIRLGDENQKVVYEDQSLTRSFLVMSGGNMLIHGDSIPNDLDDGILTAQEISRLNLSGLNLVVLSACETALGDITNEGVMGLQRGFKKAGAQTIVMSLWKVADEQTQQFMTEFYRLLTNGIGKRQAFKTAQQYMRSQYPEQRSKPYWAAFIMLD